MDFFNQQPTEQEDESRKNPASKAQDSQGQFKTIRELDPVKVQAFQERIQEEQNFSMGIIAGGAAALIGALLWGAITFFTGTKIVWAAIGVAFIVGWAVRQFGRGTDKIFGILGAGLALASCVLGNILTLAALLARENEAPFYEVFEYLVSYPVESLELFMSLSSPIDLLFYAFAAYYGYRYAIRQVTREEEESLYRTRTVVS